MPIEPHANLTITLLDRHLFGSDRFAGSMPRREVPIAHVCTAQRQCIVPAEVGEKSVPAAPECRSEPQRPHAAVGMPGEVVPGEPVPPPLAVNTLGLGGIQTVGNLLDVMA